MSDNLKTWIKRWLADPVEFVQMVFHAEPDEWQKDALRAIPEHRKIAMSACKGPGKSCLLAWLTWWYLCTREDAQVLVVSITSDNLKDNLWKELARWRMKSALLEQMFEQGSERITSKLKPETWWCSARSFPRQADETSQNTTLAGLHGLHCMIVLDEVGDYPDGVVAAAEAIFANKDEGGTKHLVMAGNPTKTDGPLYRVYKQPKGWKLIKITGDPEDPKRSPRIDIEWARGEIEKWGRNNPWVMANILGEFPPQASDQLISQADVDAAAERTLPMNWVSSEPVVWGLDVARFGDDETVLVRRQGCHVSGMKMWRQYDGTRLGDFVLREILDAQDKGAGPDAVFVDVGGIGSSVFDRLTALGLDDTVIAVDFGSAPDESRFTNKRVEMWVIMSQWIKRSSSVIPRDQTLQTELCTPHFKFKASGKQTKMLLESKEEMKKRGVSSPNRADALALTFAAAVVRKSDNDVANHYQHGVRALTEYNPLEG